MPPNSGGDWLLKMTGLPLLVRFLIRHALIGFGLALLFVTLLLTFDVGGIGTLIFSSSSSLLALVILVASMTVTFSSVQMGFAIMLLREDD